jgi:transketolase
MSQVTVTDLQKIATNIRINVIKMLTAAGSGHSAGSLGMADVFTALYFGGLIMHDPKKPNWAERDRVLLSNGHICPVWYATLAQAGYFPEEELKTLRKLRTRLQGHPHLGSLPGVENTSGPLGQGISQACGLAKGFLIDGKKNQVVALTSDGEHQEGQTWEAYMFAAAHNLHNLTVFVDRNGIQIDGDTENIMPVEPLMDKIKAFGWHVLEINGHDFGEIASAFELARSVREKPSAIICRTIPGKGVEFMEGLFEWHGKAPSAQESKLAVKEIRSLRGSIAWEGT